MIKHTLSLFLLLTLQVLTAQEQDKQQVKNTINSFFEAFHKQDTTALKTFAKGNITMQSVHLNKEGKTIVSQNSYYDFVKGIASIPKTSTFKEKLLDFTIQTDGLMANAWVGYEFWYNGKLSHCGVNSFQLIKDNNTWKIIYLVDTRRRKGCVDQ